MKTTNENPNIPVMFFTALASFQALENSKAWASQEHDKLVNKLKMAIQEKDKTIGVSNQPPDLVILCPIFCILLNLWQCLSIIQTSFVLFFCTGISGKWTRKGQDVKNPSGMFVNKNQLMLSSFF